MTCPICNSRKAKRECPARVSPDKAASICTVCCAEGREESIDCPLDCEQLRVAHRHEKPREQFDITKAPNRDVKVNEAFLEQFQIPLALIATALAEAATGTGKATDYDAREALEATIQKFRGAGSGLVIDRATANPYAAALGEGLEKGVDVLRQLEMEAAGEMRSDAVDVLKILVFLQRLEFANNNGRRLSRAFLDFLRGFRMPLPVSRASLPGEAPVAEEQQVIP